MARLRKLYLWWGDTTPADMPSWWERLRLIEEDYSSAFLASGLQGPVSGIGLHVRAGEVEDPIEVAVMCDKPEGSEGLIAVVPAAVFDRADALSVSLIVEMLEAGLARLGVARGWEPAILDQILKNARQVVAQRESLAFTPHAVMARGRGVSAPEQPHELLVCGGSPTNGVPSLYLDEIGRLLQPLQEDDAWIRWWQDSPVKIGEIFYWFNGARPGVRVRVGSKVTASIERPVGTLRGFNPVEQATADVQALIGRMRERLDLQAPPALD